MTTLRNLCLPNGGCSHQCDQGRNCSGSLASTRRAFWCSDLIAGNSSLSRPGWHEEPREQIAEPQPKPSRLAGIGYAFVCIVAVLLTAATVFHHH